MHLATYLEEVIGNHPRNQIEIVDQILSHFIYMLNRFAVKISEIIFYKTISPTANGVLFNTK
jgi:hypothetical protein